MSNLYRKQFNWKMYGLLYYKTTKCSSSIFLAKFVGKGCYEEDTSSGQDLARAVPILEGNVHVNHLLKGDYGERADAILMCYKAAIQLGYPVFALRDGGQCLSGPNAGQTYFKYGTSSECKDDGKGGHAAIEVYEIKRGEVSTKTLINQKHN